MNVLDVAENSMRAQAKNVTIKVIEDSAADKLSILIEDDGCGISPGLPPQPLREAVAPVRPRPDDRRNMGIGLSVCRSIVRAHGGELSVSKSKTHGGLCVRFYLPLAERKS